MLVRSEPSLHCQLVMKYFRRLLVMNLLLWILNISIGCYHIAMFIAKGSPFWLFLSLFQFAVAAFPFYSILKLRRTRQEFK